jgi:GNAT superfamily N-acetyltransferase
MSTDPLTLHVVPYDDADTWGLIVRQVAKLDIRYPDLVEHVRVTPELFRGPGAALALARWDGVPVGCGAVRPLKDGVGEVKRMHVDPAYRGRHIARRILRVLEETAQALGYRTIRLETGVLQPEAIRVCEACGYQRTAHYGPYVDQVHSICFEKALASHTP